MHACAHAYIACRANLAPGTDGQSSPTTRFIPDLEYLEGEGGAEGGGLESQHQRVRFSEAAPRSGSGLSLATAPSRPVLVLMMMRQALHTHSIVPIVQYVAFPRAYLSIALLSIWPG